MPIEFQCTNCQNILKVGDEHAGKSARCPSCKTVTAIPMQSDSSAAASQRIDEQPTTDKLANPFSDPQLRSQPVESSTHNPYSSPSPTKIVGQPIKGGAIVPTAVGFDEIFNYAWKVWKENLGLLVVATVIVVGTSYVFSFGALLLEWGMIESGVDQLAASAMGSIVNLIGSVFGIFLWVGQARICFKLARNQPAQLGDLFSGIDCYLPALGASIMFWLALTVSLLLLIIPGILFALYYWLYFQLIADKKAGAIESFSLASQIGKLNLGTSFVIGLMSIALGIIGTLMCLVGLLFTTPLFSMIAAVGYLKMSGQLRTN